MSKTVRVTVDEEGLLPRFDLWQLEAMQGALKSLSKENYDRLKKSILKHGFFIPVFVWRQAADKLKLMDGHQRVRTLSSMKEEGYDIPRVPGIIIAAKNEAEAKEKILLISSQFGKMEKDGLYEFWQGLDESMIVTDFNFDAIDSLKFMDEFFNDPIAAEPLQPPRANLSSVGGAGIKMIQLFFNEEDHQRVLGLIARTQELHGMENATDTVVFALEKCVEKG